MMCDVAYCCTVMGCRVVVCCCVLLCCCDVVVLLCCCVMMRDVGVVRVDVVLAYGCAMLLVCNVV